MSETTLSLRRTIYLDYRRFVAEGASNWREVLLHNQGFWAILEYRVAYHFLTRARSMAARKIYGMIFALGRTWTENETGIGIHPFIEIGEGLCIFHFGPTVINGGVKIGRHCSLRQGVTIGSAGRGGSKGAPTIGDRVDIGANAVLIGKITIGDDAAVGAGAIVTKSVPPRAVVAGNPARILSYRGSFDFIHYDGMETDPDRLASLAAQETEKQAAL